MELQLIGYFFARDLHEAQFILPVEKVSLQSKSSFSICTLEKMTTIEDLPLYFSRDLFSLVPLMITV